MKILPLLSCIILLLALVSCDDAALSKIFPKSTFDSSFPKRSKGLTNILGEELAIKNGSDTLIFRIFSNKKGSVITDSKTGDTLFRGAVSKFRGLYYFSQQLNDSSFWIYAVKIDGNLIYGLNSAWAQTMLVDKAIEKGEYPKLVKLINADEGVIRLHPEKKELKKLFATIIDSIPPDTIIKFQEALPTLVDTTRKITQIDPEDFEFLSKVYPNPAKEYVNIELQQKNSVAYQLTDLSGKIVLRGKFNEITNKIDLSDQPNGIYELTLINPDEEQKETVKIIKYR